MKRLNAFFVLVTIWALTPIASALEAIEGCYPLALSDADEFNPPVFTAYPVTGNFEGPSAKVLLDTVEARHFRTMLKKEAARGADFAGHYKIARWGCGASCTYWSIIDSKTGKVFFPPSDIRALSRVHVVAGGFEYNRASNLLILIGDSDKDGKKNDTEGIYYYLWQNDKLKLLRFIPSHQEECDIGDYHQ